MTHHLTEMQIDLYLDDGLDPAQRQVVESHLAACAACRQRLEAARPLFAALEGLAVPVPERFTQEVMARLDGRHADAHARRVRLAWLIPALQACAAVVLLVLARSVLVTQYQALTRHLPTISTSELWPSLLARGGALWAETLAGCRAWVAAVGADLSAMAAALGQWSRPDALGLAPYQVLVGGLAAALLWLVGNLTLLRAAARGSRPGIIANGGTP